MSSLCAIPEVLFRLGRGSPERSQEADVNGHNAELAEASAGGLNLLAAGGYAAVSRQGLIWANWSANASSATSVSWAAWARNQ